MTSHRVTRSEIAYDGQLSRVRVDEIRFADGHVAEREVVEHASAVAVVAVDHDGRVVLLRQYRHPVGDQLLELPAGKLDVDGESAEHTARRELAEEAGLAAAELRELVTFWNSAGWSTERTTVFLATGLRRTAAPDGFTAVAEEAGIELAWVPLDEAAGMARRGELTDAKTVIGLLLAAERLDPPHPA